jgi:hypothetical protein
MFVFKITDPFIEFYKQSYTWKEMERTSDTHY